MPIYDYECAKCGRYEVSQRITEPALTKCEKCGSKRVQRLISGGHFSLKGGGWYAEGYSGSSNTKAGKSESKSSSAA
jgi:putative FmdB family regulatory protein